MAVNLWPTRGLEVLGFEIKTRRGDWTKELKNPSKSAAIQEYCDRWWVIAGGRNIVHAGELPPTWGLMAVHGGNVKRRLVCIKEAPKLEPQSLDKPFLLALLRRAAELEEKLKQGSGDANYQRGLAAGQERAKQERQWDVEHYKSQLENLTRSIEVFEKSSGVKLARQWQNENIGMAVRVVLKHLNQPNGHREAFRRSMVPLEACLNAMKALDRTFELLEEESMGRKG